MNTLDQWEMDAKREQLVAYQLDQIGPLNKRILALIDLVRKKDEALEDLFALMDENYLIRDISSDSEPDFALRQLPYIMRLKKAKEALALTGELK